MKKTLYVLLLSIILLTLGGCRGALRIDRTRTFQEKKEIDKIVCLDPDFEVLTTTGKRGTKRRTKRASKKEIQLNNILVRNAQKNDITLQIIDSERLTTRDVDYFRDIAPLKREILQMSFLQNFINKRGKVSEKNVFNRHEGGPVIGSHFSHLADLYDTPYFAIQGITMHRKPKKGKLMLLVTALPFGVASFFSPEVDTYYYTIIADVVRAEIVYREVRRIDAAASDTNLNALVYDSFKIISK